MSEQPRHEDKHEVEALTLDNNKSTPFVSIIVIVLNMWNYIDRCLGSLESLDYPKDRYEIIVVDGGSTDGTQELIKQHKVKLLIENRRGRGLARNIGLFKAQGDIVAFVDADCKVTKEWLRTHVENHVQDCYVGAVGGSVAYSYTNMNRYAIVSHCESFSESSNRAPRRYVKYIPTCNASFKKRVLKRIGFFDDTHIAEDFLLSMKINEAGFTILFDPRAMIYHFGVPPNISSYEFIKKHLGGGRVHFRIQTLSKTMLYRLPTNRAILPFFMPSIILARTIRQFHKIRYADLRPFDIITLIPYITMGGFAWGIGYLKEAMSYHLGGKN